MRELNQIEETQTSAGIINPATIIVATKLIKAGAERAEAYVKSGKLIQDIVNLTNRGN